MDIIIALVFISLTLVIGGLVFFFSRLVDGDFEHGERLSLLPLADDDGMPHEGQDNSQDDNPGKIGLNGRLSTSDDRPQDP